MLRDSDKVSADATPIIRLPAYVEIRATENFVHKRAMEKIDAYLVKMGEIIDERISKKEYTTFVVKPWWFSQDQYVIKITIDIIEYRCLFSEYVFNNNRDEIQYFWDNEPKIKKYMRTTMTEYVQKYCSDYNNTYFASRVYPNVKISDNFKELNVFINYKHL